MMRTTALTLLMLCGLVAAGDTEAEKLYRDAWWRESSQADYPKALEGYRNAVDAAGPDTVRAKALLKVADLLKRLGRTEEALAALEDLRKRFPNEAEVLATAGVRAKEWTAVDLRQSYSDWYRRYMFSPEFQEKVVEEVLDLASSDAPVAWLLSIGDAAVPALQESATSRNRELVQRVVPLLLKLGSIPPAQSLLEQRGWAEDRGAWLGILRASEAARRKLRDDIGGRTPFAALVKAAATSPAYLVRTLAGDVGARVAIDEEETLTAVLEALHATRDPSVHAGIADLAVHPDSPAAVQTLASQCLLEFGWVGADAGSWLRFSRDAKTFERRRLGIFWAARELQPDDGETIDAVFDDIEEMGKVKAELRDDLGRNFAAGLERNGQLERLPWSPERLRRYMEICLTEEIAAATGAILRRIRSDRTRGLNVVEAILVDPVRFVPESEDYGQLGFLSEFALFDTDEPDEALAGHRWARWTTRTCLRRWKEWTDPQRVAALQLARLGFVGGRRRQQQLASDLSELVGSDASERVQALMQELREATDR